MATKFVDLEEAAKQLGVSADQLNEMRSKGEIYGYRDGSSWKFKEDEVARVIAERADSSAGGGFDDDLTLMHDVDEEGGSSILVSEEELGKSGDSTSSTIIGKGKPIDSDISLGGDTGDSDVKLAASDSDLKLEAESDIGLAADSGVGSDVLAGEAGEKGPGDTGKLDSDLGLDSDAFTLDESELTLGSDIDMDAGDSALALTEDDDDMVLGGSGTDSDVTLGAGDSGIGIGSPDASGIDLEDISSDLGGSAIEALELPEDEESMISLDDELLDPDAATQLKAGDDDFLLGASGDDDSDEDDSGSQVIALDDSSAFDNEANTMLNPALEEALVAEDAGAMNAQLDAFDQPGATATPLPMQAAALPEAPYSVWNVLSLFCIVIILAACGMLMTDLVRNMWSWDSAHPATTSIMDEIVKALGL